MESSVDVTCWICWWTSAVVRCVGLAVVVRQWLLPWAIWLGRRAFCWTRYFVKRLCCPQCAQCGDNRSLSQPSTCPCCSGINYDGMAGRWAVVTGCSDGIGKEYALQLCDQGINVVLVSRNANKLQDVANDIHKRHSNGVQTRIIVADFTSSGCTVSLTETYESVRQGLVGLDIALLINNAGIFKPPKIMIDQPPIFSYVTTGKDPCLDLLECNAQAAMVMCQIVMPLMINGNDIISDGNKSQKYQEHDKETSLPSSPPESQLSSTLTRGGVVINISSSSSILPCPLFTLYASTKAFLNKLSEGLQVENEINVKKNPQTPQIAVRCLIPGFVSTKMSQMRVGRFVPSASLYARNSLRSLGCHCGCRMTRRLRRNNDKTRNTGSEDEEAGWIAGAVTALFDSPSSPFSLGQPGVTTTGYLSHTLMVMAINAAIWLLGEAFVSNKSKMIFTRSRDNMKHRDAIKAKAKAELERQDSSRRENRTNAE